MCVCVERVWCVCVEAVLPSPRWGQRLQERLMGTGNPTVCTVRESVLGGLILCPLLQMNDLWGVFSFCCRPENDTSDCLLMRKFFYEVTLTHTNSVKGHKNEK